MLSALAQQELRLPPIVEEQVLYQHSRAGCVLQDVEVLFMIRIAVTEIAAEPELRKSAEIGEGEYLGNGIAGRIADRSIDRESGPFAVGAIRHCVAVHGQVDAILLLRLKSVGQGHPLPQWCIALAVVNQAVLDVTEEQEPLKFVDNLPVIDALIECKSVGEDVHLARSGGVDTFGGQASMAGID